MSTEWHLSRIGLETASFFLVTTDLYGKERLLRLSTLLEGWLSSLKKVVGLAVSQDSQVVITLEQSKQCGEPQKTPSSRAVRYIGQSPLLVVGSPWQIAAALLLRLLMYSPLVIYVYGVMALTAVALFLVRRSGAKGLLLMVGSIMFLIVQTVEAILVLRG